MGLPVQISIIIPTRNEATTVQAAVAQYLPYMESLQLELIFSDANSTDGTVELLQEWVALYPERIRLVQCFGKQNIAIGRNAGANFARGAFLFHSDADVRVEDPIRFFSTLKEYLATPSRVACTTPIRIYREEEIWKDRIGHLILNGGIRWSIFLGLNLGKGECQFVKRTAFEAIGGYNEGLVAGEDCDLFLRLKQEGTVHYLPTLEVRHSPRRFRALGYSGVAILYLKEGISRLFTRKSYSKEWVPTR